MDNINIQIDNLVEIGVEIEETIENHKIKQDLKLEIKKHNNFFAYQITYNNESLFHFIIRKKLELELEGYDVIHIREKLKKILNLRQFDYFKNKFYCLAVKYPELKNSDIMLSQSFKNKVEKIFFSIGYYFNINNSIILVEEIKNNNTLLRYCLNNEDDESEAFRLALKYNLPVINNCDVDEYGKNIYKFLINKISMSPYIFNKIYDEVCNHVEIEANVYNQCNDYGYDDENYLDFQEELPKRDGSNFLDKMEEYAYSWWEALDME
ncbi:FmhA protein of FemAB family [Clostridium botulinum B str. Osaka05]|uniref:FmhA protein of FemAB family n=1 Tax=Clostridium botulinum B str. Osaka05 TaxID=1407017 RepID=A0A060N5Y8_CLOBO|nr:hypothetical protein [Clostridium botulinum]BAO04970.1 FmhA protein of FemAB family [Clostridium botulinum B str. Osaka05]